MIKRLLCVFTVIFIVTSGSFGQAPNYAFQAVIGTYTPIAGGTAVTLTYNGAANNDDGIAIPANAVPLPFAFNYNGINYTAIRPCANGWATFSTTATANNTDTWTNNLASGPAANQRPFIAPLWDDMDMSSGTVSYLLSGSAPTRVMTIQWAGCKWDYNAVSAVMSFQVKLYETSNIIEFIYNQEAGSIASNSGGATIGLAGTATNSFLSLTSSGTAPLVSASVEKSDIVAKPASGQIYRWIPYCSASGTNTAGEKISNFTYNTVNNNSASTAIYENFSNLLTTVSLFPNSVLPFSVNVSSFIPTDQVILFIDFNHNGDFSDPGETVYTSSTPLGSGTVAGNITIPPISATVLQGRTRLRIRLHDTGNGPNAGSCGASTTGQVEDYSVDIQPCFAAVITTQPANIAICNGGGGVVSIATTGSNLTYQWQVSTNGGGTYANVTNTAPYSGATTNTLNIASAGASMNGYMYRVIINGTCTAPDLTSSAATLTINTAASITANPVNNVIACQGGDAAFTVTASGSSPQYQWQVSNDGGINYSSLGNATSSTLNLQGVSNNMSLNRYRAIATVASCGSVTSGYGILKVNPLPDVTLSAAPLTQIQPGLPATLFATSNPVGATYSWTFNGVAIPGATGSTLQVSNLEGLGKYKATVTDINGCSSTTNEVSLTGLGSDKLFVYPSPSPDGKFYVRLYTRYLGNPRVIRIYNSLGAVVAQKEYYANQTYQEVSFDFTGMQSGIYTVEVKDKFDLKTAVGRVIIR
jgi:hypothetical protein